MSYRRSHQRSSHMRTNADGSKSFVRESYVKGHKVSTRRTSSRSIKHSNSDDNWLLWLLFFAAMYFIFS